MAQEQPVLAWIQGISKLLKDRQLLTFGFFLLISTSMWTLNKLSQYYVSDITGNLTFSAPNASYMVHNDREQTVQMRVNARGYDLMRYKFFSSKTFTIVLHSQYIGGAISTSSMKQALAQQLGNNFELRNVEPDSIDVRISSAAVKKVPVRTDFALSFAPQYMLQGSPMLTPDSVTVSGPHEIVSQVREVYTKHVEFENVQAHLHGSVALEAPKQTILLNDYVSYNVNVQRFTQALRKLPIRLLNVPDSISTELIPATAQVSLFISLSNYSRLNAEDLQLVANYDDLYNSISGEVQVCMSDTPAYVLSLSILPQYVTVIIKK